MKKYLFAYAVLATALLFFTCRHYRAENRRLVENQTALAADVTRYRTRLGAEAASVQALRLRCGEFETLRAADAEQIRRLGIRLRRLEAAAKAVAVTDAEIRTPLRDTVVVRIHDTLPVRDTVRMFRWRDPWISVEGRIGRDYNSALGVFHNANFYTISASYGKPGMTRKIVDSYLMADGSRFTDKAGWETMEFKQQCSNRDPRLAQTIRTPGYTRIGATTKLAPDLANSITGYHVVKFVTGTAQDAYNKSFNDLPIFRSAEVYLNFAEAKAELGTLTQEDINLSVKRLRDRVGMSNLILDDANKNPDPYLSDAKTGYPNVTGANKGVILEIRRERTIELAMEGFRYYDIMRWKEGKTFEQPLLGLYIPAKGEYDIDGDGTPDVYFATKGETPSTTAKLTLVIDQDILFSDGDHGYISPHKNNPGIWDETRDYFYPIPTDDRSLTGGALTQNPGWNDGLNF